MVEMNEIKFNQQFIFEAKTEATITSNGALFFIAYTPYGKFNIFEENTRTNFYQGMFSLLSSGERKTFYIRAKAKRMVGNQYGDKAEFIKDKLTGEPMVEIIPAPELLNLTELRKEVTIELNKLTASNERYGAFVRFALSKTLNPQNQSFIDTPAGIYGGYAFRGGLLAHTVRMLKRIEQEMYINQNPLFTLPFTEGINYDLLKLCAFIHEIGKCQAYTLSFSGLPEKTLKGKINHHLYWTSWEVNRLLETYNMYEKSNELKLTEAEKMIILDVTTSCHYFEGREGVAKPKTKEGHIFNKIEYMDHRLAEIEMAEYENQGKCGFIKLMGEEELITGKFIKETTQVDYGYNQTPLQQQCSNEQTPVINETITPIQSCEGQQHSGNMTLQQPEMPINPNQEMNYSTNEYNPDFTDDDCLWNEQVISDGDIDDFCDNYNEEIDLDNIEQTIEVESKNESLENRMHHIYTPQQQWYEYATK